MCESFTPNPLKRGIISPPFKGVGGNVSAGKSTVNPEAIARNKRFASKSSLIPVAKKNARQMTKAEQRMWFEILRSKKTGYKFIKQYAIQNFIVDFYCSKLLLVIEVDGSSHDDKQQYDQEREQILQSCGLKIIRYTNNEVLTNIEGVWEDIEKQIDIREEELRKNCCMKKPTPYPLDRGKQRNQQKQEVSVGCDCCYPALKEAVGSVFSVGWSIF